MNILHIQSSILISTTYTSNKHVFSENRHIDSNNRQPEKWQNYILHMHKKVKNVRYSFSIIWICCVKSIETHRVQVCSHATDSNSRYRSAKSQKLQKKCFFSSKGGKFQAGWKISCVIELQIKSYIYMIKLQTNCATFRGWNIRFILLYPIPCPAAISLPT